MQKPRFERFAPPGTDTALEIRRFRLLIFLVIAYALCVFTVSYLNARSSLFEIYLGERVIREGAVMEDFREVLSFSFAGFAVVAAMAVAQAVRFYAGHYRESRSIYLMRRLPDRMELHRRCLTLPVAQLVIGAATAFILLLIFYLIYMKFTPEACLSPGQWSKIWRSL